MEKQRKNDDERKTRVLVHTLSSCMHTQYRSVRFMYSFSLNANVNIIFISLACGRARNTTFFFWKKKMQIINRNHHQNNCLPCVFYATQLCRFFLNLLVLKTIGIWVDSCYEVLEIYNELNNDNRHGSVYRKFVFFGRCDYFRNKQKNKLN